MDFEGIVAVAVAVRAESVSAKRSESRDPDMEEVLRDRFDPGDGVV